MLTIYKITHRTNGFVYVGQTSCGINIRWARHIISAFKTKRQRRCRGTYISRFHRAVRQHGINSFKIEVIKRVDSKMARQIEKDYIQKFTMLGKSYNMQHGGMKGMRHSKATKNKISKLMTGVKRGRYFFKPQKSFNFESRKLRLTLC